MAKMNLHLYPSVFKYEARIRKETKSLTDWKIFDTIMIVAIHESGMQDNVSLDSTRQVVRVQCWSEILKPGSLTRLIRLLEWQIRVLLRFRCQVIDCLNCHSIWVLPVSVMLKYMTKAKLIYDTHELETETVGNHGLKKYLAKFIERALIKQVDSIITVNESISNWYRKEYSLTKVHTVKNVPNKESNKNSKAFSLKAQLGLRPDDLLCIYQGLLAEGRGIEILLDAFAKTKKAHIVFLGFGKFEEIVKSAAARYTNIHFCEAVPPDQLLSVTSSADIGISLIENVCLSYYLSLPNKLFEYLVGGIPVIASNFPEMSKVITDSDCGWCTEVNADSVVQLLENLDWEEVRMKKRNITNFIKEVGWHNEEFRMFQAYEELGLTQSVINKQPSATLTTKVADYVPVKVK